MERSSRKVRTGFVVRKALHKTTVVKVERHVLHPLYGRVTKKFKKFLVHDEKSECAVGDRVEIMETRPLSKRKRWRMVQVLEKAK